MRKPQTKRRGGVQAGLLLLVVLAAAVAAFWWRGSERTAGAADVDAARLVTVEARDVIDSVNATGRVEPLARVAVMSRASGIVKELYADEGDAVKAGAMLAELDREQLQADLDQDQADLLAAEARVAAAKARLEEAKVSASDPEPDYLRREFERLDGLLKRGDVSQRERDDAAKLLSNAEHRVRLIEASLPVLEAQITEAEAGLAAAKASVERSQTSLREATILSPVDGVVLTRDKEVGDGVSSILTAGGNATQLMTLGDLSKMHVEARVDEVDLGRIEVGMPALVTVDAHRTKTLTGRVRRIAPAGSVDTNGIVTFEVEVAVEDPERLLKPDMTAEARLVIDRRDGVPSLPQSALILGPGGDWSVDVVRGDGEDARIERTAVELGLSDGLMTELRSGVSVGDRVLLPPPRR